LVAEIIRRCKFPLLLSPLALARALALSPDLDWVKARASGGFGPALVSREKPPI
jgi:hypothetical protein